MALSCALLFSLLFCSSCWADASLWRQQQGQLGERNPYATNHRTIEWDVQQQGYHASQQLPLQSSPDCSKGPVASKTCECSDGGARVICRSTNIYSLQHDIPCPQNIQHLTLINPQFSSRCLTRDNMTSLPNLKTLTITGSNLEILTRDVFRAQRQLKVIDLRNNLRLTTIDPDAFGNLPSLTCIDLSQNERLGNLPPSLFVKSPKLATLNLSSIGLSELPQLPTNGLLKVLDVSNNQLASLPSELVQTFCRLDQVYLAGNPWCCSRQSRWLSMFIRIVGEQTVVRDQPVCQGPNELYGWPIRNVSPDRMDNYHHCKGYSGLDDSRTCNELYSMFRNVIPNLPQSPDNRVLYDNRDNNGQFGRDQVAEFERGQDERDNRVQKTKTGGVRGGKADRVWLHNSRQSTTPENMRQAICLASVGGDCTTGNIIVGTIAAVAGAAVIAGVIGIVKFVKSRRTERFRSPSVL